MFSPLHLKTLYPLQVFSVKPSSSSSLSSSKLKSLIRTLIVSHMCRLIRALSKFKAIVLDIVFSDENNYCSKSRTNHHQFPKNHCSKTQKIILGSFRLHYNWCSSKSSHVIPVATQVFQGLPATSSAGNSNRFPHEQQHYQQVGSGGGENWSESELAGYLQWLEEKDDDDDDNYNDELEINEIDMRAEMFIANCHEKFRLEKQESDRRFQEMLARGL